MVAVFWPILPEKLLTKSVCANAFWAASEKIIKKKKIGFMSINLKWVAKLNLLLI
ncbi:MAG: hypothetical protein KJ615_11055 [Bacteroidetes bacterium]|nr:hypothetical protein [Bacteroidota bacterium]